MYVRVCVYNGQFLTPRHHNSPVLMMGITAPTTPGGVVPTSGIVIISLFAAAALLQKGMYSSIQLGGSSHT